MVDLLCGRTFNLNSSKKVFFSSFSSHGLCARSIQPAWIFVDFDMLVVVMPVAIIIANAGETFGTQVVRLFDKGAWLDAFEICRLPIGTLVCK